MDTGTNAPHSSDARGEGRRRSTIAFPYASLDDAEHVAEVLQRECGASATAAQLAAALGTTSSSGAFRMKVAALRTFGIVESARGPIRLSELGRRLVDPQTRAGARVDAFLRVPLFRLVFEEYSGGMLPGDKGLEKYIADAGVSPKQAAKARQALQRSAEHAGFLRMGRNRLVKPSYGPTAGGAGSAGNGLVEDALSGAAADPIQAAWLKLLREGRSWPADKTHEYVEAARRLQEALDG